MNVHEYQAKELFAAYGVPAPRHRVIRHAAGLPAALDELGGGRFVVKAQVHAGGRGKAGGVRLVESIDAAA
jgi:succinyl-CoA synthetase beta subunit